MEIKELEEYTADVGYEVICNSEKELFQGALITFLKTLTDSKIGEEESYILEKRGNNLEEMIFNFIEDLIYLFEVKKFIPKRVEVNNKIKVFGEKLKNHNINCLIKAVTKHNFKVEKKNNKYILRVVYDV